MIVSKSTRFLCNIESPDDYATIPCSFCVLKLSNGFVTGYIHTYAGIETMLWEELQELLLSLSPNQYIKIDNNIYQYNGIIFFENLENKVVKLSFHDLFGKLVHESITTSNSYRPVLKGNIFICTININNKLYTIKYIVK